MDAATQKLEHGWLNGVAIDTAKLGLLLYVCGLFSFSCYYSQFRILSIDLAKPEAILIGFDIVCLFAVLPQLLDGSGEKLKLRERPRLLAVSLFLLVIDFACAWFLDHRQLAAIAVAALTVVIQIVAVKSIAVIHGGKSLTGRAGLVGVLILSCIQFSFCWLPKIPAYYGGGRPYEVQIFTKTADLPANRFFNYKNQPKINNSIDSFKLRLLYETDKDLYFVDDLREGSNTIGYSVMRIKRDEISRVDYETPKWLRW